MLVKPIFEKAVAETRDDFHAIASRGKLVFLYIFEGDCDNRFQNELPDADPGELYLAFDLSQHGEQARRRLLEPDALEQRTRNFPGLRPVPYLRVFITGVGYYDTAYSANEVRSLVLRSREELKKWHSKQNEASQ